MAQAGPWVMVTAGLITVMEAVSWPATTWATTMPCGTCITVSLLTIGILPTMDTLPTMVMEAAIMEAVTMAEGAAIMLLSNFTPTIIMATGEVVQVEPQYLQAVAREAPTVLVTMEANKAIQLSPLAAVPQDRQQQDRQPALQLWDAPPAHSPQVPPQRQET